MFKHIALILLLSSSACLSAACDTGSESKSYPTPTVEYAMQVVAGEPNISRCFRREVNQRGEVISEEELESCDDVPSNAKLYVRTTE